MKHILFIPLSGFLFLLIYAQHPYQYYVDLIHLKNKAVKVELVPPALSTDTATFCFPAVVPGTYEQYDFGRFIKDFKVLSKNSTPVSFKKINTNCYKIFPAQNLEKIEYLVTDTWHTPLKEKIVFEPAGTNIMPDSVFVINNHGFFGYFHHLERQPFIVHYRKPENFFPASAISTYTLSTHEDVIAYTDYHQLADFPLIYSVPDTSTLNIYNTKVFISCYSPHKKITAAYITSILRDLLFAFSDFFDGKLPVEKYAFLFYFTDKGTLSGASGALEHNQSSLYVLPELDSMYLAQTIKDVAAHEFLHILTPLNIHSEQIEYFDFNNPEMSQHLWLYEGSTEYHAHYLQEKKGLISPEAFLDVILDKIQNAQNFNDTMSFTKMSKNVLQPYYHQNYNNVYEKGALISMCLDLLLIKESHGEYNLRKLLLDLSKKYGKLRPFKDDSLFYEIEKMTFPSIGKFLKNYVEGNQPLPLSDIFALAGLKYVKEEIVETITFGGIEVNVNEKNQIYISSVENLDDFGKQFGFKEGDIIYAFNNRLFTLETAEEILSEYAHTAKENDLVSFEIIRTNKKGISKNIVLKGKVKKIKQTRKNVLSVYDDMNEEQKFVLRKWLGNE